MESTIISRILPARPVIRISEFTNTISLRSNFLKLSIKSEPFLGVQQYHISFFPEIERESKISPSILKSINSQLRESYNNFFYIGESLFSVTLNQRVKEFFTKYSDIEYKITIQPTPNYIDLTSRNNYESIKFKSLLEKLIKVILRENPNMTIFFKNYFNLNKAKKVGPGNLNLFRIYCSWYKFKY
jgi:hypothetical protein